MSKTRIYLVTSPKGIKLVDAATPAAAIRHVAIGMIKAEVADAKEVAELIIGGTVTQIERAGEEPETAELHGMNVGSIPDGRGPGDGDPRDTDTRSEPLGSDSLEGRVDINGMPVSTRTIVRAAFERAGMSVEDWNALPAVERDSWIIGQIEIMRAYGKQDKPARRRRAATEGAKA
jgi:hypothetical protein